MSLGMLRRRQVRAFFSSPISFYVRTNFSTHPDKSQQQTPLADRLRIDHSYNLPNDVLTKVLGVKKENTRFHLTNIPAKISVQQLTTVLTNQGIQFRKLIKLFGKPHAKIAFENQNQAKEMLKRLAQFNFDNKKVFINPSREKAIPTETKLSDKRVEDITTPWWNIPYEEQLQEKELHAKAILSKVTEKCDYLGIERSPEVTGYRNKIGFTIGFDAVGRVTIGFVMGKFKEGIIHLGDPSGAVNSPVHPTALHFRQLFEEYFKSETKLPVYDKLTQEGFWRGLEVRTFNSGENSLTFQVNYKAATEDEIENEIGKLVQILVLNRQYRDNTSIMFQEWAAQAGTPNINDVPRLAYGKPFLHETLHLGGKKPVSFRVQPTAFFQTNSYACEILYRRVVELCKEMVSEEERVCVLDICCGTGTIGLCVASQLPNAIVHGVDIVESSIQDAKYNAQLNNISSANYIQGDVRKKLRELTMKIEKSTKCVAIVDPPRPGVHSSVLKALATCDNIDRIIYIACNPETIVDTIPKLSPRYKPVKSFSVDMFPQTAQQEMVVCLDKSG